MKKSLFTIMLSLSLLSSCKDEVFMSNNDYDTVINFKESGIVEFNLFNIEKDVVQSITVGKGGYKTGTTPNVTLVPFTEQELQEYNNNADTDYKLIPSEYYTLPSLLEFSATETYKNVDIIFKGSITRLLDQGGDYLLPIKIETDLGITNSNKGVVYFKPNLITPTILGDNSEIQTFAIERNDIVEQTYGFDYYLDLNSEWDFNLNIESDQENLQLLVDDYNNSNMINCKLLPADNYVLPSSLAFNVGDSKKTLDVTIKSEGLELGDYLLPVKATGISDMNFDVLASISYIHVSVQSPKNEMNKIALSVSSGSDGVISTNSISMWSNEGLSNIYDGNEDTHWHSWWNGSGDPNGDPNHNNDPIYGIYFDIALNNVISSQLYFDYTTRNYNNKVPAHFVIYVGTNENDLVKIGELEKDKDNLAVGASERYESKIFSVMGKENVNLIRISMLKSWDEVRGTGLVPLTVWDNGGNNSVAISEFNLYCK